MSRKSLLDLLSAIPLVQAIRTHFIALKEPASKRQAEEAFVEAGTFVAKRAARGLRSGLERQGVTITHAQSLDALSSALGFADWNTGRAHLAKMSGALAVEWEAKSQQQRVLQERMQALGQAVAALPQPIELESVDWVEDLLIVGHTGAGKSRALRSKLRAYADEIFAARPVLVLTEEDAPWRQLAQSWEQARPDCRLLDETLDGLGTARVAVVCLNASRAHETNWRDERLCGPLLNWLEKHAHERPLVIMDGTRTMGTFEEQFVLSIPDDACLVYTTQCIQDVRHWYRARFKQAFVMQVHVDEAHLELAEGLKNARDALNSLRGREACGRGFLVPVRGN